MPRIRTSLDVHWDFFIDPEEHLHPESLDRDGTRRTIRVPGPWQAQADDLRLYTGVAWYRLSFDAPALGTRQRAPDFEPTYILHFGAVDYHARVWLNGERVGEHEGGYLPFELPLDDSLRLEGGNQLVVRVLDPGDDASRTPRVPFAEIPHGKQSWYGPVGGIWQSSYIEVRHAVHITRLQVTPDVAGQRAHVSVRLNRPATEAMGLILTANDPLDRVTRHVFSVAAGEDRVELAIPIPGPMLWDTHSPHLYRLEATLTNSDDDGLPLDRLTSHFGMRTIATSDDGHLVLNGRVLYLRGALDQDYYPEMIYTPFSDAELDDQFAKAKHMGLNCLRTHIKITDPRYYDAADRAGMLIWAELPNWENLTEAAKRRARETLTGMVERDWNHPSIVIWTIINEGWGVELAVNAEHRAWLAETYAYLKQLDPQRLVVGNSPCFANFHVVTDIEDFHNYYHIPDHYRAWRDWVQTFASRPPWTFAHTYKDHQAWEEFRRDPWNPLARTVAPEVQRRGSEPMVVSEFGNWGLPDVERLRECYGGQEPWWFETGMEWGEGVVYPHGIERRFKVYHLDKVFETLSELAAASQRMQFTALKYEIEQMRRQQSIVGYIITEFTDVHWEANGLLDICRNPKAYYDVIGQINSADAVVADWDRIAFWEGERCEVRLVLSHFSDIDLQGARLEWHLDLQPELQGVFEDITAPPGTVTTIGTVVFDAPAVAQGCRARLELRLVAGSGTQIVANHLELYLFPRHLARSVPRALWAPTLADELGALGYHVTEDLDNADVAVVETMTDGTRWYLQTGGRVLWLAEREETKQTYLGSLGIARREERSWQGDWASSFSWIRRDGMFKDLPTKGTVDFAFADLTPEQVIVGLTPRDFASDVHAGLFVGWIHHTVALVAERRFGPGRLLTSTFRLCEHLRGNPVARIMFNDMLEYVTRAG